MWIRNFAIALVPCLALCGCGGTTTKQPSRAGDQGVPPDQRADSEGKTATVGRETVPGSRKGLTDDNLALLTDEEVFPTALARTLAVQLEKVIGAIGPTCIEIGTNPDDWNLNVKRIAAKYRPNLVRVGEGEYDFGGFVLKAPRPEDKPVAVSFDGRRPEVLQH